MEKPEAVSAKQSFVLRICVSTYNSLNFFLVRLNLMREFNVLIFLFFYRSGELVTPSADAVGAERTASANVNLFNRGRSPYPPTTALYTLTSYVKRSINY